MIQKYFRHLFFALFILCTTVATAHDFEVDGICYNILSKEDKTVEVTYKGTSFSSALYSGNVVIPERVVYDDIIYAVTAVGMHAFHRCYGLTDVAIPESVTSLGDKAFYYCYKLTTITIPNSVRVIGGAAFDECSGLSSVHINDLYAWCNIDFWGAFSNPLAYARNLYVNGEKVKELVIPDGVAELKKYAFYGGSAITSVVIPESVTAIGSCVFYNCFNMTNIKIPNSVKSIGEYAFYNCRNIKSFEIPTNVTSIGSNAFYDCTGLTSLTSLIPVDALFTVNKYVFCSIDKNACILYVPYGAKDAYASTEGWNEFANIVELEPAGIDEVDDVLKGEPMVDSSQSGEVKAVYDLQGRVVENPTSGVYIIDGKKVLVK